MPGRKRTYSEADKERFAAERQAKLEGLQATLTEEVGKLAESAEWERMLQVAARFHHYSPRNIMLILAQMPTATRVAGFRTWQSLGRQVRKREKGLVILAPMKGKREVEDAQTGDKSTVAFMRGFRGAAVFDISQTDGEPLPQITTLLDGEGDSVLYEAVIALIERAGFTFEEVASISGSTTALGVTDQDASHVEVLASLSGAMRLHTVLHEYAHAMLHHGDDRPDDKRVREIEAESFAYVVLGALGHDASCYATGYVAGWASGSTELVKATAERVLGLARATMTDLVGDEPAVAEAA